MTVVPPRCIAQGLASTTSLARVREESAESPQFGGKSREKLRSELDGRKAKNPSGTRVSRDWPAMKLVARGRIELPTYGFSDRRSTN